MLDERRPSFAQAFPRVPPLDALVAAFARGDYAHVRAEAPKLAASAEDEAVRAAARTLVERTQPDPVAVRLLVLTAALLVALTAYWIIHGKPPPGNAPTLMPRAAPPVERVR
jgi:hypothetical protein